MRATPKTAAILLFVSLSVLSLLLPVLPVHADPAVTDNGDGTSTAVWNFANPANYTLSGTSLSGNSASLAAQETWWNTTTQADFTGGTLTNTELGREPGTVDLQSTSQSPQTMPLQPTAATGQDSYIDGSPGQKTTNFGTATTMLVDNFGTTVQRAILRFDLSTLPANAVIDGATMTLYMTSGVGNTVTGEVHYLTTGWNQATVTWNAPWGTSGGDFSPYLAAQATLGNTAGPQSWNVTQLVDLWYRGRLANDGVILLIQPQGVSSRKTFYASDWTTANQRPQLTINYRVFGNSGTYVSNVGGPGSLANWNTLSWNATSVSLVSDEFSGTTLSPKWGWTNAPASFNVGVTTPGSLRVNSSTGTDLWGGTASANLLTQSIVGNFTAQLKFSLSPSANYQKAGMVVYLNGRNWYSVGKTSAAGVVDWAVTATSDAASASRYNVSSGNPVPAYVQITRSGNTLTASVSSDGVTWTLADTYLPATEYPWEVRLGFFVSDGRSGTTQRPDVDSLLVTSPIPSSIAVQTRMGNTSTPDPSWSAWSAAWPNPLGSTLSGNASYLQYQLSLSMGAAALWPSPGMSPAVGDVNVSSARYVTSGTVTTNDLAPSGLAAWGTFTATTTLNGQTVTFGYSLDAGATWTPIVSGVSLAGASIASGTIRFRAAFGTSNTLVTPILTQLRLTYSHVLDHFYVTGSPSAVAGGSFTVTVTAKDIDNDTISAWSGNVALAATLADGVTPGSGTLGVTSLTVSSGGTATLATETYTKAETIRLLASLGSVTGLSGNVVVGPGPLASITVTPSNVTLLPLDSRVFTGQGFDAYANPIAGLSFSWALAGGIGGLNATSGASVNFTASTVGNGTLTATSGTVSGAALIHVVTGVRPWLTFQAPVSGAWLTGVTAIRYTNSTDAVNVSLEYNPGAGWTPIGGPGAPTGILAWDTRGLNFTGGSLRATVTNARTVTNTTTVSPINVDNAPPTISLGTVTDSQATSGTLTLTYTTSPDTVRLDFSYFDGSWHAIGSTTSITGSYVWTPGSAINGVTVRAVATDQVGLTGSSEEMGVGTLIVGANAPSITPIPTIHVQAGAAYVLNLTFYVSDPDTPLADLGISTSDAANVTVAAGPFPTLTVRYALPGTYTVALWVSDGTNTAWALLTIVAAGNQPPVLLQAFPPVGFDENTIETNGLGATVSSFFSDPDGDPLNYTVFPAASISYRINANGTIDFWAARYWHGRGTFRIRATDPSGGFAEGGFLVVVRWIDQAPVLAALPALTVNASQATTLDLTPYISDVDTPLANITVSVGSPYVTVQGHTLMLNFPANWTGSSFNVTISDGILTATQNVRVTLVIPPPPPEWWQAPYVLAIPPVGLFVVVAMFVQRQRWRPTKAFLVDERGQLLREFTLEPSCKVSYEQAVQAGALDAVDNDVRVSKYHARAVHGDLLSLIMLAVGPANVQEIEFARGLLVSIQDTFEDGVRQRAEEVRTQEATLEGHRASAEEDRADLQARARVFGDMVNAFTIARTKMDADSQTLRRQDADLREREARLAGDQATLNGRSTELEELHESLDRTATDLEAQRKEIQDMDRTLAAREASLSPKEQELAKRVSELSQKESEFSEREGSLASGEAKLIQELKDYQVKAQQSEKLEGELAEERRSLDDLSVQIDQESEALKARTASVEAREADNAAAAEALRAKLAEIEPREQSLGTRESDLARGQASLSQKDEVLTSREKELAIQLGDLRTREAAIAVRDQELADERKALDDLTREAVEERKALDTRAAAVSDQEADVARKMRDLADLKENLGPRETALIRKESDLATRERTLADERTAFQSQEDLVERKALEIEKEMEAIKAREAGIAQEKILLQDAKGAFDAEHRDLEAKRATYALEAERRGAELAAQERTLGEARVRLTKESEAFEAQRLEKSQWIASKEIELEAKEQTLADREAEIRAQGEENGRHLAELASREETLEIESDKLDKARAEAETRKAELGALTRDFDAKTAKFRNEEARKGEELRTWQATIESEQALLKEQKETFEKEMQDLRESWAGRLIRVEQREEELKERETKVQADVEWVARNESELVKREKLATDNLHAADALKAEGERLREDLEQRSLEIESRERSLREEAANQAVELEKRVETLQAQEAELAGRKAQSERELGTQTLRLKDRETELLERKGALDAHEADLVSREATLVNQQSALRGGEDRLGREKMDLQAMEKQLEARQLELGQTRERLDAESLRLRTETDSVRQSLAAKEADLGSERERLERESSALQDKLGGKAKEMAAREKALAAREEELRSEEQDLEARTREIESRERQAEARAVEITAREKAMSQGEQEQKARRAQFDDTVQKFEADALARQQEWKDLQATLKSQEAQLAASTETRQAEIRKRMEDLEQRERTVNATLTQAQIERTRLEDQANGQSAKQAEIDAAAARADKRFAELKTMEDELLKTRQAYESEKAGWAARRNEELKQLEATRDAAGEQTGQAERLIEESQRRAYVAAEAEKAAKRQGDELAAAQAVLERRRVDAEKAEKDLEAQMAQLREASQRLGASEIKLGSRAKDLDALQARLSDAEKKALETTESLRGRKTALDQEAERISTLAAELDKRQAEVETRHAAVEGKLVDVTKREQVLSTELQRADNLMEDLNRKEAELVTREKGFARQEAELAKRGASLAQRDTELREGMQTLERLRREQEARAAQVDEDHRVASEARKDAEGIRADAEKLKAQADAMQAEVAKNMRFLQKKALDVLDREEKLRGREVKIDEQTRLLESRAQILDQKDRALESEEEELTARLEKTKQENDKLKAKLAEAEKSGKSTIDVDEWKRDIENRVKIIQKKALDLLDREEKLRKKEEELRALAAQLGVEARA